MKYVLFLAGVVLLQMISVAHSNKAIFDACATELGISKESFKDPPEKNLEKPEFRCLHTCILKKLNAVSTEGPFLTADKLEPGNKINFDTLKQLGEKFFGDKAETVLKTQKECAEEAKTITEECDFINAIVLCTVKKIPDLKTMFKASQE